ncbi:TorF family putative porin [Alteromonas facilis]|uniref:TorF family putative porin n=1 Tax=Alteromonas facilis TaxID=2048004 RepID=UPI000C28A23B|nr:TorF family putative porin [Alteromonas facilis]
MKLKCFVLTACLVTPFAVNAEWSSTITLASDYLFNGVSQTDEDPALQGSIDWEGETGWYAGTWASNVDFGDDTDIEIDLYVGYWHDLGDDMSLDIGIAQYTYHGGDFSSDGDYAEAYIAWGINNTELKFWYAWDYFGTGAGHYITKISHTIPVNDDFSVLVGVDRSVSMDEDDFVWEDNDKDYIHWQLTASYAWQGFDFTLGVEGTDLDTYGDTVVLATASKTFSF